VYFSEGGEGAVESRSKRLTKAFVDVADDNASVPIDLPDILFSS
jgi:hypothetical protein